MTTSASTDTAAIAAVCPSARAELPRILPASRARAGTADSRISTIRVCFSVTVFCAIVAPNPIADSMKTKPKPNVTA